MAVSVPPFPIARFSVEQYHRMIESGAFTEHDQIELLEGWVVEKTAKVRDTRTRRASSWRCSSEPSHLVGTSEINHPSRLRKASPNRTFRSFAAIVAIVATTAIVIRVQRMSRS